MTETKTVRERFDAVINKLNSLKKRELAMALFEANRECMSLSNIQRGSPMDAGEILHETIKLFEGADVQEIYK